MLQVLWTMVSTRPPRVWQRPVQRLRVWQSRQAPRLQNLQSSWLGGGEGGVGREGGREGGEAAAGGGGARGGEDHGGGGGGGGVENRWSLDEASRDAFKVLKTNVNIKRMLEE